MLMICVLLSCVPATATAAETATATVADTGVLAGVSFVWLLMQERVGSTWLSSSVLAQHPQITMLSDGHCEACWGFFDPTKWHQFREGAMLRSVLAQRNASLLGALPPLARIVQMRGWSLVRWRGSANESSVWGAAAPAASEWRVLFEAVSEAASLVCIAQLGSLLGRCEARPGTQGMPRVCGWKGTSSFCPTARCDAFVWGALRPKVVRLYRQDALRQATSLTLAKRSQTWSCPQRCNTKDGKPKQCGAGYSSYKNMHRDVVASLSCTSQCRSGGPLLSLYLASTQPLLSLYLASTTP